MSAHRSADFCSEEAGRAGALRSIIGHLATLPVHRLAIGEDIGEPHAPVGSDFAMRDGALLEELHEEGARDVEEIGRLLRADLTRLCDDGRLLAPGELFEDRFQQLEGEPRERGGSRPPPARASKLKSRTRHSLTRPALKTVPKLDGSLCRSHFIFELPARPSERLFCSDFGRAPLPRPLAHGSHADELSS